MEWWREAGVEHDFNDDVTAWLGSVEEAPAPVALKASQPSPSPATKAPAQPNETPRNAQVERVDFFRQGKPQSLEAFREFWLNAPGLDVIGPRGRVAPRGVSGASVMVLVVDPEEGDAERLLSGPQGALLDRILAAMGVTGEEAYIASALPRNTPMADTQALAAGGMDTVLHHHIALAAPKRLIAFGAGLAPLLGQNVSRGDTGLPEGNQNSQRPPVFTSEGLDSLRDMPRLKARFWRRWMEWSALH